MQSRHAVAPANGWYVPGVHAAQEPCPVWGCTVADEGYAGVDADTPFYRSRAVGVTGVGAVAWPAYRSVLNYDPRANVLRGCVVAVEGCMDPSAPNYDPLATADSNDWCVARRTGCMVPPPPGGAATPGAALNYDPNATVVRPRGRTSSALYPCLADRRPFVSRAWQPGPPV